MDFPINKYHIRDLGEISFINELIWTDKQFKQNLFKTIQLSKNDSAFSLAAANSISLLNYADVSFNNVDFSGISVQGANLQIS